MTRNALVSVCGNGGRLLAALLAAFVGLGCGEQDLRVIERLPEPLPVSPDRGRVQVREGNLLTDKGTRLRGVTLGIDAAPDFPLEPDLFAELSQQTGLNAFHVYLESPPLATGARVAQADLLVELTSATGMYIVLGIGGGSMGGSFDLESVLAFWRFYGPRYAERTHVLYEIKNVPQSVCSEPYAADALEMERLAYEEIRAVAPSTHVAFFSFLSTPSASAMAANLDALGGVDWSKASVAFHTAECEGVSNITSLLETTRARSVAAFASELPYGTPLATTAQLESERTGWFNFDYLVFSRDLAAMREAHDAADISWCPDFGGWPEDSQSCSTP